MDKFKPGLQNRPLQGETNLSILRDISNVEINAISADTAYNEFYYRFYKYVWIVANRVCAKFSKDPVVAEDVFQEVMSRVYLKADLLIKGKNEDVSDITIKAWLGRIANNILMDYIRYSKIENGRTDFVSNLHDGVDFQSSDSIDVIKDINLTKLQAEIEKLDERAREILYLYIYNTERKVSGEDLKKLSIKYGIGVEAIRKIYYRTIDHIKNQLKN